MSEMDFMLWAKKLSREGISGLSALELSAMQSDPAELKMEYGALTPKLEKLVYILDWGRGEERAAVQTWQGLDANA